MRFFYLIFLFVAFKTVTLQDQDPVELQPTAESTFEIYVGRYSTDCYFQPLKEKDIIHVVVNVLSGADDKVNLIVSDPNKKQLYAQYNQRFFWYDSPGVPMDGDYRVCLHNMEGVEKRVYFSLIVVAHEQVKIKTLEDQFLNETHHYLLNKIHTINYNIFQMRRHQVTNRISYATDAYIAESNNEYVQSFSLIMVIVVVTSALVQTHFIKKLFASPAPGSKPFA